ncbi:MAG: hypothetical protein P8O70_04750 [SAR324 cluster bacterium]|nr:hypothetical protein [SAR324 cluster bacterium]
MKSLQQLQPGGSTSLLHGTKLPESIVRRFSGVCAIANDEQAFQLLKIPLAVWMGLQSQTKTRTLPEV